MRKNKLRINENFDQLDVHEQLKYLNGEVGKLKSIIFARFKSNSGHLINKALYLAHLLDDADERKIILAIRTTEGMDDQLGKKVLSVLRELQHISHEMQKTVKQDAI